MRSPSRTSPPRSVRFPRGVRSLMAPWSRSTIERPTPSTVGRGCSASAAPPAPAGAELCRAPPRDTHQPRRARPALATGSVRQPGCPCSFPEPISRIVIDVEVIVELAPRNPFEFLLDRSAERFPFDYGPSSPPTCGPTWVPKCPRPVVAAFVDDLDLSGRLTTDVLVTLGRAVASAVEHRVRDDPGVLSTDATLLGRTGSCRDSAWLLVQLLRLVGLAARFVSGYLVEIASTGDLTDLHAWVEVYLPGAGWVGIDSTSGLLTGEGHIPLAVSGTPGVLHRSRAPQSSAGCNWCTRSAAPASQDAGPNRFAPTRVRGDRAAEVHVVNRLARMRCVVAKDGRSACRTNTGEQFCAVAGPCPTLVGGRLPGGDRPGRCCVRARRSAGGAHHERRRARHDHRARSGSGRSNERPEWLRRCCPTCRTRRC